METILEYLPLIIPLLVIELILVVAALVDLSRRETTRGPRWAWVLVIIFVNLIGPIIYFLFGREEE